jgi:hypothetical protein
MYTKNEQLKPGQIINNDNPSVQRQYGDNDLPISGTNPAPVQQYGVGVPPEYTKQTSNGAVYFIQKGQLNKYRIRPAVLNEHAESSRTAVAAVTAGNIVGQIFKASQDNINGIMLTLQSSQQQAIDDFESYADSAALQAAWPVSPAGNNATLETTIVQEGAKSMALPTIQTGDEWEKTVAANYTDFTFDLKMRQTNTYAQQKIRFFIKDNAGNSKSFPLVSPAANSWNGFSVLEGSMVEDQVPETNPALIVAIGFRVEDPRAGSIAYIDDMEATPQPGSVGLKLWDMGPTLPVDGVTSLDDGTQYTELGDRGVNGGTVVAEVNFGLLGGKRLYTIREFAAGTALEIPDNTLLNVGNYYAITLHYVDTNLAVFGPEAAWDDYYENGYSFTAPDEATAITATGPNEDLMFGIFSTQPVYLRGLTKVYDSVPGAFSTETLMIEDKFMRITDIASGDFAATQVVNISGVDRFLFVDKGGKFEVYHNDDPNDSVSQLSLIIRYIYEPPVING